MRRPTIAENKIKKLRDLYINKGRSMFEIARYFHTSLDAVLYVMRKNNIPRRSLKEASKKSFENKKLTFKRRKVTGTNKIASEIILAMLYWGEGFKGNDSSCLSTVDFANSDPEMIKTYMKAFRNVYEFDKKKLRVLLYCYSNQNIPNLISFWSKLTRIPKSQFTKPYIRKDSRKNSRVMKYGLIHIRYNDKKLLIDIKNLIHYVRTKYA